VTQLATIICRITAGVNELYFTVIFFSNLSSAFSPMFIVYNKYKMEKGSSAREGKPWLTSEYILVLEAT